MPSIQTAKPRDERRLRPRPLVAWPLLIALCAVAFNQRTFIASFGALVPEIRDDAGASDAALGALASLPLVCFAVFSAAAPGILKALGQRRSIGLALLVLAAGVAVRGVESVPWLFLGTCVAGVAVTLLNVALPGVVRSRFADRAGWATGAYSVVGAVGTASAAALTVPLHELGLSWGAALAVWAVPILVAALVWVVAARTLEDAADALPSQAPRRLVAGDRRIVVALASYLGFQSIVFFCLLSWLPDILDAAGFSGRDLGVALAAVQVAAIPATFLLPAIADRVRVPGLVVLACGGAQLVGLLWIAIDPVSGYLGWAVLLGIGTAAFPLGMYLLARCARSIHHANLLSARSQLFAYVLAALGPFVIGAAKDSTGSWTAGLVLLVGTSAVATVAGLFADRHARRPVESSS